MSKQTHREELERRHHVLELEIYEAQKHPSCDDLEISELKRRKFAREGRDRAPAARLAYTNWSKRLGFATKLKGQRAIID